MNDSQIIAIAIVLVASLASVMFNNMRITDLRTDLNARMGELRTDLNTRMGELRGDVGTRINEGRDSINQHIDDKFARLDVKLDRIIEMLASHDERITKLEKK